MRPAAETEVVWRVGNLANRDLVDHHVDESAEALDGVMPVRLWVTRAESSLRQLHTEPQCFRICNHKRAGSSLRRCHDQLVLQMVRRKFVSMFWCMLMLLVHALGSAPAIGHDNARLADQ